MIKRIICMALSLVLCCSAFIGAASAASDDGVWFDVLANCNYFVYHPNKGAGEESAVPRYTGTFGSLGIDFYTYLPIISDVTITFRSSLKPSNVNFDGIDLTYSSSPRTNTYIYKASDITLNGTFPTLYVNWTSSHAEDFRIIDLQFNCGNVSSLNGTIKYSGTSVSFPSSSEITLPGGGTDAHPITRNVTGTIKFSGKCDYVVFSVWWYDLRSDSSVKFNNSIVPGPGLSVVNSDGVHLPLEQLSYVFVGGVGYAQYKIDCSSVSNFSTLSYSFYNWLTSYEVELPVPSAYSVTNAPKGNVFRDVILWLQKGFKSVVDAINPNSGDNPSKDALDQKTNELNEANKALEQATKPAVDDIDVDVDSYVSQSDISNYSSILAVPLSSNYILPLFIVSMTFVLVAYVFYGKR